MSDTTTTQATAPTQGQEYAEYGGRRFPFNGATLEQVKSIMARFFAELAEPKIEKKVDGGDTIYVFTKKVARLGAGDAAPPTSETQAALYRARAVRLHPDVKRFAQTGQLPKRGLPREARRPFAQLAQVTALRQRLAVLQPDVETDGAALL